MLNVENFLDLPLIWSGILALAVFLYVLLDGFTLGVGILFPFAPTDTGRNQMMNSIAPFWDGNETWLVLGGGGLFAAFPKAFSIIMPAFYMPIIIMLIALIFRGVAFEFRYKASQKTRFFWDYSFHFGSLIAAFAQGLILGGIVQGIEIENYQFAGDPFGWINAFSIMIGIAIIFGYALLGATWLLMKTEDSIQIWARKCALYCTLYVAIFLGLVSLWVPFLNELLKDRWFSWPNIIYLLPLPIFTLLCMVALFRSILAEKEFQPFILTQTIFVLAYCGLIVGLWPWIVPYQLHFRNAAAAPESLTLLLIGAAITLPLILLYTGYSYYVFRGKAHDQTY